MKSVLLGIAAVLVLLGHPAAHAEDQDPARTLLTTAGPAEVQEAALKPTEGAIAKLGAVVAAESSASLLLAVSLAKDLATPPLPPPITLTLKVDLGAQRVSVLERGDVKYVWAVSSGREGYATQTGTFQPQWTSRMWYSRQWDMAPMPHAVFFNKGTAFHATSATGALGRRASHGCIRLAPANAAKLYALVHRHGLASTKVIVQGAPKEPAIAKRKGKGQYQQAGARQRYGSGAYYQAYDGYRPRQAQRTVRQPNGSAWGF